MVYLDLAAGHARGDDHRHALACACIVIVMKTVAAAMKRAGDGYFVGAALTWVTM